MDTEQITHENPAAQNRTPVSEGAPSITEGEIDLLLGRMASKPAPTEDPDGPQFAEAEEPAEEAVAEETSEETAPEVPTVEKAPDPNQALLKAVEALQAKIEQLEAKGASDPQSAPLAQDTPEPDLSEAPLEYHPIDFVTDDTYDEAVGSGQGLNKVLNTLAERVVRLIEERDKATFKHRLVAANAEIDSVKSEGAKAAEAFWGEHPEDLTRLQSDPRLARRFMAEVNRVAQTHPELAHTSRIKELYGKALEEYKLLEADFVKAAGIPPKAPVAANAPKPAFAGATGARPGFHTRARQADSAVQESEKAMDELLGLKRKKGN